MWGIYFSVLFKGKVLDVFVRFLFEIVFDFNELKNVLLKWFDMMEDGFCKKFWFLKLDGSEIFM